MSKPRDLPLDIVLVHRLISKMRYWNCLRKLLICIHKCSTADKVVSNCGNVVSRIEQHSVRSHRNSGFSIERKNAVETALESSKIIEFLDKKDSTFQGIWLEHPGEARPHIVKSVNFIVHIGSVALRIANQSSQYWFNKIDDPVVAKSKIIGLLDLQREIDPLNPKFLSSILKFFLDQPQQKIDNGELTLMLFVEVAREKASIYQSFLEKSITKEKVRISLSMLFLKIVIVKADSCCTKLQIPMKSKSNEGLMCLEKDLIETILEGVKVYEAYFTHQTENPIISKDIELIFMHIEASARGVTSLYYSFIVNKIIIEETILTFSDLLDEMAIIKEELREIYPRIPRPNFPTIPGLEFIDFHQENLSEKLKHCLVSIVHRSQRIQLDI
ncbi:hypothetical protein ACH5RR_041153 [Cinchona calisaya]|uniref:Uncharacterized protein n=1 Tax=Cinchona calisaya TaxID=153742 RepID=A0ABD2XUN5_9GENT